ncbi:hypothetical protein QBC40DRAFT_284652 [Triangularia verruculosa]|uniref:Uncharacterized protein n=1 Tax=Triangularia verruculosa TaxID=2587418 RepID=A0AAN6XD44_9PEZI|nr:hypothetical protein QBC40DRAFT_284652 [Triangularia verruculosa]
MGIDGSTIAAILTGILALVGAVATAWMSGWNQQRVESRKNRKALARSSVPLLIASWDLANWLYDILEPIAYSPRRCKAYGDGWPSDFTSYLFGQYFAGVHIIREMTQFFAHIQGGRADQLKRLLWKIQDEFVSMHYEGRENIELRWAERHILEVQEAMTVTDGADGGLRAMRWIEFQENYKEKKNLWRCFKPYEDGFQRIVYRRFKYLYSTVEDWKREGNPQEIRDDEEAEIKKDLGKDEKREVVVVISDHRARRLQHLLVDLVGLLDEESGMKFNRPVRRCTMVVGKEVLAPGTAETFEKEIVDDGISETYHYRIPCDCYDDECNQNRKPFKHRNLKNGSGEGLLSRGTSHWEPRTQHQMQDGSKSRRKVTDNCDQC